MFMAAVSALPCGVFCRPLAGKNGRRGWRQRKRVDRVNQYPSTVNVESEL